MAKNSSLFIFQKDLRLDDNPALNMALSHETAVIAYILDPQALGGQASCEWLHVSLSRLSESLAERGIKLILAKGRLSEEVLKLAREAAVDHIYWNRSSSPYQRSEFQGIKKQLNQNVKLIPIDGCYLHPFEDIKTQSDSPYKVFTPYFNSLLKLPKRKPVAFQNGAKSIDRLASLSLDELGLRSKKKWAASMMKSWQPGEFHAKKALKEYIKHVESYESSRNTPCLEISTSKLSPHLSHGEISPIQVLHELRDMRSTSLPWMRQVVWREFAHYLLWHFPNTSLEPLKKEYASFPVELNPAFFEAWQKGLTGFPIVDAGMRELWHTGWMHNRVRMIVASFLIKDMHLPYKWGEAWFKDTLVDYDEASNIFGWQWSSGGGADSQPYYRIFNPESQAATYDPDATYIKNWIPELENANPKDIIRSVNLEVFPYPKPILHHGKERLKALALLERFKKSLNKIEI